MITNGYDDHSLIIVFRNSEAPKSSGEKDLFQKLRVQSAIFAEIVCRKIAVSESYLLIGGSTKMVNFGLKRSVWIHLGPPTVLWPLLNEDSKCSSYQLLEPRKGGLLEDTFVCKNERLFRCGPLSAQSTAASISLADFWGGV